MEVIAMLKSSIAIIAAVGIAAALLCSGCCCQSYTGGYKERPSTAYRDLSPADAAIMRQLDPFQY
jgi:hypothetical protein